MNRAAIVGGGDFSSEQFDKDYDFLIAADSGYAHLKKLGIVPDIAVGDWDSLSGKPTDCKTVTLPCAKDETDLAAAARLALEKGYNNIVIYGALGGKRFSHSLAAIQMLGGLTEHGAHVIIVDENCRITALENAELEFSEDKKGSLSVFSLTESCTVSLRGLWYSRERLTLRSGFPLGVSNSFIGKKSSILVTDGIALVVLD